LYCFWDRISLTLPRLALNLRSSCLCFPSIWYYRSETPQLTL
jgi:hypothetical protein